MNFKIIILLLLPIFLYSDYYDNYWRNKSIIENNKINLKHQRFLIEKEEAKEKERKYDLKRRTREAKIANEKYFRELKYKNMRSSSTSNYVKKTYNPDNFKNRPQIKLGELHILGVKSIKPFKKNKYIIQATNGTFAIPKDKFDKAEKINFTAELMKWKIQ